MFASQKSLATSAPTKPILFPTIEITQKEKYEKLAKHFKRNTDIFDVNFLPATKYRSACIEVLYDEDCKSKPTIPSEFKIDINVMMRPVNAFGLTREKVLKNIINYLYDQIGKSHAGLKLMRDAMNKDYISFNKLFENLKNIALYHSKRKNNWYLFFALDNSDERVEMLYSIFKEISAFDELSISPSYKKLKDIWEKAYYLPTEHKR